MANGTQAGKELLNIEKEINGLLEKREMSGEKITRGLKKEVAMYQELVGASKEAVKNGKLTENQAKNHAKTILKVAKLKNDQNAIEKELANNAKKMINAQNVANKNVLKDVMAEKALLQTKLRRVKLQQKVTELQNKAASKVKEMIFTTAGVLAVWSLLKKTAFAFAEKIDNVGKTFGAMASNKEFVKGFTDAEESVMQIGFGMDDVISTASSLASEWGIGLNTVEGLEEKILDTAKATGLSQAESTKLFGTFMKIGGLSKDVAEDLIEGTFELARQKGVAPTAVLKDMASNAELIADFTDDTGDNIAAAAIQAVQLGLSLGTTSKIADGLLNFQTSIQEELNASIITGKQLNLQKARELALSGDLAGMQQEVVSQLGSVEELTRMDVFQKRALAKAVGVTTTELTKMVKGTKDLSVASAMAAGDMKDIHGKEAISNLTALVAQFKSLAATAINAFGPEIEKTIEKWNDWITDSGGMDGMRAFVKDIGKHFRSIAKNALVLYSVIQGARLGAFLGGPMGALAGGYVGLIGGSVMADNMLATPSLQTLPANAGADILAGSAVLHQKGNFGTETVLHTNEIVDAIKGLRKEMGEYLGFGGTAITGIGREHDKILEKRG